MDNILTEEKLVMIINKILINKDIDIDSLNNDILFSDINVDGYSNYLPNYSQLLTLVYKLIQNDSLRDEIKQLVNE